MPDRRGRVYIAEHFDRKDATYLTGRFMASWQSDEDESERERGPDDVTADEAIAWGRRRADVVLIRVGDGNYHSAGAVQPEGEVLPEWPPPGLRIERRRAPSEAHWDRTEDDDPIVWEVDIHVDVPAGDGKPFAENFANALVSQDGVMEPECEWRQSEHGARITATVRLSGRTSVEVHERGNSIVSQAFRLSRDALGELPADWTWHNSVSARPVPEAAGPGRSKGS